MRLTDHRGYTKFFTETFEVDKKLPYQYVTGTFYIKANLLKFNYDNRVARVHTKQSQQTLIEKCLGCAVYNHRLRTAWDELNKNKIMIFRCF